ncbi:MAG: SDR family oxidoreductase [Bryobacteraceae bacterium]|nr:SDR family oxidoreductase [Bryobacteraceae bacterium]
MRVLVAGAAGFIGSHLCDALLAGGCDVLGVDNFVTGSPRNLGHLADEPRFRFLEHDIVEPLSIEGPLDAIFNLASPASPRDYLAHPVETLRTGAEGTRNLLELARTKGACYVLASTSEVYGDPLEHPQKETYWGNVNPVGPRSCYDESKRFAEALVMAYHRRHGLCTHIARIFNTYGPRMQHDDGRIVPNFIVQALRNQPITVYGDGSQTRSFCYVDDLVEGLILLSRSEEPYPVNLGNPHEMTVLEFARLIRELTGSESEIVFEPLPEDDPQRRQPDIGRAKSVLGWKPRTSLQEGLRLTIEAFRRELGGGG